MAWKKPHEYHELCQKVQKCFLLVTGVHWNELLSGTLTFEDAVLRSADHANRHTNSEPVASSSTAKDEPTSIPSLEEELDLLRNIMLLANTRPKIESSDDTTLKKCLSINFTFLLVGRANGLRKWMSAAFDFDDTSQTETTFDQRFLSASKVITYVPVICVKLPFYYHLIAKQIWSLLRDKTLNPLKEVTRNCVRRLCNLIVSSMIHRSKEPGRREIISPVLRALDPKCYPLPQCPYGCSEIFEQNQLKLYPCEVQTPQHSLEIVHSFLFGLKLEFKYFVKSSSTFAQILYIRLALEESLSPWKGKCEFILKEILNRISNKSIHLLMSALFIHYDEYCDAYRITREECASGDKFAVSFSPHPSTDDSVSLQKIDLLSSLTFKLIGSSYNSETKVNLILLFFDELSRIHLKSKSTGLLLCTLLGELMMTLEPLVEKHPGLFIRFLVASLDRAVHSEALNDDETGAKRIPVHMEEKSGDADAEDDPALSLLHIDSVQISLQIIKVLILHKDKLSADDITCLKTIQNSLTVVRDKITSLKPKATDQETDSPVASQSTVDQINELIQQIASLSVSKSECSMKSDKNELEEALKELNDPIMPTRAHALISIKHMIIALNPSVIERKNHLLELLIATLSDAESYIYLAAIGTLEMAARLDTGTVLPVLLSHYCNQQRSIQERLNTGETIVRLSKSLGPTAPIHAKSMINTFTDSLKDPDVLIRVSSLSNLGQICKALRHSLSPYITHIMHSVTCLLSGDPNLDVKRSALMFIHLTLSGVDSDCIHAIQEHLVSILKLVRTTYNLTLDDLCRLHAQLALEELERIVKELTSSLDYQSQFGLRATKPVQIIE